MDALTSPAKLIVRCLAERRGDQWQAFSLEFGLAAQGSSFPEVKAKLDSMINDYVYDALVGEDRQHAQELLTRRAPWKLYARYYAARLLHRFHAHVGQAETFFETMRLTPTQTQC